MKVNHSSDLYELLEAKYYQYNRIDFIENDPICIPHRFSKKEDIEIAAFLTSIISWGQRKTIIKNANRMMLLMDESPHEFILNHTNSDLKRLEGFVHRTFNALDLGYFFASLQNIYKTQGGLEKSFQLGGSMAESIHLFKQLFFTLLHEKRTQKHIADPLKGSSAKRINMFLRWMVRQDDRGVDFGIWKSHSPSQLMMPLDVHTATVGRSLALIERKQNDWKAVEELTASLRAFDPQDPVKYDFSLFGMGVMGDL